MPTSNRSPRNHRNARPQPSTSHPVHPPSSGSTRRLFMSLERFTRRELVTATGDQLVGEVARLMHERHVGAVVIVEEGRPVGIVTDRDLVLRVLAKGLPASEP